MKLTEYLEKKYSKSTAKYYKTEIGKYLEKNKNAQHYNYGDIEKYIAELRTKYKKVKTVHTKLQSIKKYYNYLVETEQRADNPIKNIYLKDNKKTYIQLQELYSTTTLENLLNNYKSRYKRTTKRDQLIISLVIYQGLKAEEIIAIQREDINLNKAEIHIKKTNTTNSRTVKIENKQILIIYEYLEENTSQQLIKLSKENIQKFIKRNLKISITKIRQSVVANKIKQGEDIRKVQHYIGHKHIDTTERYKQNNLEELKQNIEKYHPIK